MTLLFVVWLLQDFAQLLLMGICIVPDVFLMTALFMALLPGVSGERQTKLVWAAFAGGLLWDLRWTNLPGLSAAIGGGVLGLICFLWYKTPAQGRTAGTFTVFAAHGGNLHRLRCPHASALFRDSLLLLDDAERLRRPPARRAAADGRACHRRLLVALLESIFRPWLAGVIPAST